MGAKKLRLGNRVLIGLLFVSVLIVVFLYALSRPLIDFGVYWTASHLFIAHGEVYSLPSVFAFQKSIGLQGNVPNMFLSPPWTLPLLAPLGYAHSYVLSWLLWVAMLACAAAFASRLLMDLYFGPLTIAELSDPPSYRYLCAFTFYPLLLSIKFAQFGPMLLLAVAGFLYFQQLQKPIAAGACLGLLLIKPHFLLLFLLALVLRREWKVAGTVVVFGTALSCMAVYHERRVFAEYWSLMSGPYPKIVLSGILGGIRGLFGPRDTYWFQFIPPVAGSLWFIFYFRAYRNNWSWKDRAPALTVAAVVAAPYGFLHDQALLVVPLVMIAASLAREFGRLPLNFVVLYTVINVVTLVVALYSTQWCILPAPLIVVFMLQHQWKKQKPTSLAIA